MLKNAPTLAIRGVNTAENELSKCSRRRSHRLDAASAEPAGLQILPHWRLSARSSAAASVQSSGRDIMNAAAQQRASVLLPELVVFRPVSKKHYRANVRVCRCHSLPPSALYCTHHAIRRWAEARLAPGQVPPPAEHGALGWPWLRTIMKQNDEFMPFSNELHGNFSENVNQNSRNF